MKRDLNYLELLGRQFPDAASCAAELIGLRAQLLLPKGNEYYFSDIHGEYESFSHLLRSASGVVGSKIKETFENILTESEQAHLAELIQYPKDVLFTKHREHEQPDEWYKIMIHQLVVLCREVGSRYTRLYVRKNLPERFGDIIDELIHNLLIDSLHIIGDIFDRGGEQAGAPHHGGDVGAPESAGHRPRQAPSETNR